MIPSRPPSHGASTLAGRTAVLLAVSLGATSVADAAGVTPGPRVPPSEVSVTQSALPIPLSVARALEALREARGSEAYAALRGVWSQWDQTDPAFVEEAISGVGRDPSLPAPIRAYASILGAYARRRRGDLDGARAALRAVGMVDRWLVVGPFDNEGRAGFNEAFGPEKDLAEPIVLTKSYPGKELPVHYRTAPDVYGYGWLDLGDLLRPREKICAYATTFVRSQERASLPQTMSIWVGVAGAFKLFFNGSEVLSDDAYRGLDSDRMAATVALRPGYNCITVKACSDDDDAPMISVRLADAKGAPLPSLETSADPNTTQDADAPKAKADAGRQGAKRPPIAGGVEGPLSALAKSVRGAAPAPAALEAFARYLRMSGGDDPTRHEALDMARRAAEMRPTWQRALLSMQLAPDRNEKRKWLTRAEELAPRGNLPLDLILAKAELARTGTNWRDAVPFYDQALVRDPTNTRAILGRAELYNEAGLKRTALLTLESAVTANPRAVGLLRVYAASLRDLGRTREADEVAERYASLRFDDATYLGDRIELAVLRRDEKAAYRWIDRLLSTDPDSSWARATAARAYRSLGQHARALAAYQSALTLCPEDAEVLRAMADLYAEQGDRDQQLRLLRQILAYKPQEKDIREYVEHIEPPKPRADEAYAWDAPRFLPLGKAKADGELRRTLRDLTVTTVFSNGLASHFRQVVFQPLTDEAAAAAREYAFLYQADSEIVQLRAARVYRADGKVDEAVESGDGPADNPALAMYTSARTFYVHFPRLSAGDVVELRYRVEDVAARNEYADYFGEVEYLQKPEAVAHAEYVLRTPKNRALYFRTSGLPGIVSEQKDEGDTRTYSFRAGPLPPIVPEPLMPPMAEILGRVHVSTYKTWDQVASWYWGLAKDQLTPDDALRRRVAELTRGLSDPADKVRAIYGDVVQKTRYVALEFGIYGHKPRPVAQTLARGWGDCKDKAALIISMLKLAGIDASMVLVRTGLRGEIEPEPPSLAPFDHAIAYVPSMKLFLDGTAEYTGSTELPPMDRGAVALIVDPSGKGTLTHLPDPDASATRRVRRIDATPTAEGGAVLDVHLETSGALAAETRQRYHAEGTRRERVARDMAGEFSGFELAAGEKALEVNDLENIEQPVRLRVRGKAAGFGRREGSELSIAIGPVERLVSKFTSLSTRKQRIRLMIQSGLEDELTVHIPPSMRVKSLPEPVRLELPFGTVSVAAESLPGKVVVRSKVEFHKSRIGADQYAGWRAFCEAADRALSQRLVLGGGAK